MDDGSTDDTIARLAAFGERIRVVAASHGEKSRARNLGIEAATGTHVAFLDSDDLLPPDSVTRRMKVMEEAGGRAVVYGRCRRTDLAGVPRPSPDPGLLPEGWIFERVLFDRPAFIISCLVPRDALREIGRFREDLTHAEDTDLQLRLACKLPWRVAPGIVAIERDHADRSRRQYERILDLGMKPVDAIFAWPDLPPAHRALEARARAFRLAALARAAYRLGRGAECRAFIRQAIRAHPRTGLGLATLRRYFASFLMG